MLPHRCGVVHRRGRVFLTLRRVGWVPMVAGLALTGPLFAQSPQAPAPTPVAEAAFSFIHASDTHFGPAVTMPETVEDQRSWAAWRAIAAHGGLMSLAPYGVEAPAPSFIATTGDVTEFGWPGATVELAARYYEGVAAPVREVAGNHDNTWVADTNRWRARSGGLNSSWDMGGVRFVALSSASLQEPLPSFGEEAVAYLADLMSRTDAAMPVILMWHHPPQDSTFASRYDVERVMDVVRDHNVVAMLVGHYHAVRHEKYDGIPVVHGGSTFGKSEGYNVADVRDGRLRMAYRSVAEDAATTKMVNLALHPAGQKARVAIESPAPWQSFPGGWVPLAATIAGGESPAVRAYAEVNDGQRIELALEGGRATGSLDSNTLANGAQFVRFVFEEDGATTTTGVGVHGRSAAFTVDDPNKRESGTAQWRTALKGSIQSAPTLFEGRVYVGDNAGRVTALDAETGTILAEYDAGAEVLAEVVAWRPNPAAPLRLVVGTGAGALLTLDENLKPVATFLNPEAIYSTAAIDDAGIAYVGTNGGDVVAVRVETGELVWRNSQPDYSIEMPVTLAGDLVLVGAWDGYFYALHRADGSLAWKAPGPRNLAEGVNRYYAPADAPPVVIGDKIYLADRAYSSGKYALADGTFSGKFVDAAVALGATADGEGIIVRHLDKPVALYGLDGTERWTSKVVAGRNPVVPTTNGRGVFVVDQKGLLTVLNARNGAKVWNYQVTPGQYVFANVTPVDNGAYTAGMDGRVTYIRRNGAPPPSEVGDARRAVRPAMIADDSPTSGPEFQRRRAMRPERPGERRFRFGRPSPTPDHSGAPGSPQAPSPAAPPTPPPAAPQP